MAGTSTSSGCCRSGCPKPTGARCDDRAAFGGKGREGPPEWGPSSLALAHQPLSALPGTVPALLHREPEAAPLFGKSRLWTGGPSGARHFLSHGYGTGILVRSALEGSRTGRTALRCPRIMGEAQ